MHLHGIPVGCNYHAILKMPLVFLCMFVCAIVLFNNIQSREKHIQRVCLLCIVLPVAGDIPGGQHLTSRVGVGTGFRFKTRCVASASLYTCLFRMSLMSSSSLSSSGSVI